MTESTTHGGAYVTGQSLEEFEARVARVGVAMKSAIKEANNQNGLEFMQAIAAHIPRDTGRLLNSMKKVDVGEIGVTVEIGDTHPYYLNYVEYGHMDGSVHVPPQPFWWPTWRLMKRRFRARSSRAGNAALKKAVANGA